MADRHDDPAPTPSLDRWLEQRLRGFELELQVCCQAHVVSYAAGRATIQLGRLPVPAATPDVPGEPIVVPGAPVCWPGNGSTCSDTWLLPPGSIGLAVFGDRALDRWLELGAPADPVSGVAHGLGAAMFLPLVPAPDATAPTVPANPAGRVLEAPQIFLGSGATQAVALAQLVHTYLLGLFGAQVVVPLDGGASAKASALAYLGANPFTAFAATKVYAQ